MKNDALLEDLKRAKYAEEKIENLRQADIVTYERLLTLLGDDTTEPELRIELCGILSTLRRVVDRRRGVGPLLAAFHAQNLDVSWHAARAIGMLDLKRAIPALSQMATDKSLPYLTRVSAIQALGSMHDTRALSVLRAIVADKTDNPGLRGDALEQTVSCVDDHSVREYITLLSDDSADLRFWAAYCLGQLRYGADISAALNALDHVVASDHTVPTYWGWHVDREALLPFEFIYFRSLSRDPDKTPGTWIVSPAAEFNSFLRNYRHWTDTWAYTTDSLPAVTLNINKSWLAAQLQQHWATIELDIRQPRPQAYLIDFRLMLDNRMLIGGLHRDGYTLVLTGDIKDVCEFVAWYRGLFAPDIALFLYEWADVGISLTSNISAQGIAKAVEEAVNASIAINCIERSASD